MIEYGKENCIYLMTENCTRLCRHTYTLSDTYEIDLIFNSNSHRSTSSNSFSKIEQIWGGNIYFMRKLCRCCGWKAKDNKIFSERCSDMPHKIMKHTYKFISAKNTHPFNSRRRPSPKIFCIIYSRCGLDFWENHFSCWRYQKGARPRLHV